jgi:transcriptional regulator with GAF, ATPase, and Fis domain
VSSSQSQFRLPPGGLKLEEVERQLVVQALERARGNQTRAGQLLGINRDQVRYRIEKFGLVRPAASKTRDVADADTADLASGF